MNDLIKDLATKAIVENISSDRWVFNDAELEKFAQSIVLECIATMTNLESDIKQQFPWKKEEVVSTSGHIQKLKEHFGVEE